MVLLFVQAMKLGKVFLRNESNQGWAIKYENVLRLEVGAVRRRCHDLDVKYDNPVSRYMSYNNMPEGTTEYLSVAGLELPSLNSQNVYHPELMSDEDLERSLKPSKFDDIVKASGEGRDKLQVGQLWRRYWGAPGNLDRSWFMVLKVELKEEDQFANYQTQDSFLACIEQIIMWGDAVSCVDDSITVWPMTAQGLNLAADVKAKFATLIAKHDPDFIRSKLNEWTL